MKNFQFIPRPCLHAAILLLIRVMREAAAANTPNTTHQAFLRLHMISMVVFRKYFRGERGWRSTLGQMHALRRRITRAGRGERATLWQEALAAHKARQDWYSQRHPHQRNSSSPARRTARAMRFASQAQYT